ncbi:hypothetical protein DYB37_008101 [Aphanomyces astaci]|uniref:Uncharacterized protein n=1 Tax=Aphanomyces astaci TaxID=112090 RepID=A0A418FR95_APHAT|nr:hypothetical protein DYB37_008101 [Aphanomyces astaci]
MLCYPPGVDFAKGFWGCLYTIHPTCPPYPDTLVMDLPRFNRMVADSGAARVIMTTQNRWSPLQTSLILLGLTPQQHNDVATADRILRSVRHKYRRVLIVIEGEHSMGGDLPDLPVFVALKRRTSSICR